MTAVSLVHQAVINNPDRIALRFLRADRTLGSLTYQRVWDLSSLIAARLTGDVLAVAIDDGPYLALAELAGWRKGMLLVPLDPHDPVSRLQHSVAEAGASCIVVKDWGDAKKLSQVGTVLDLSLEVPLECTDTAFAEPKDPQDSDTAAYMWFTSGITASSTVLIASASTFDPSIGDIFATWAIGGVVAVAPRMLFFAYLGWAINQLEVTHVTCTPSLWQSLEAELDLPKLTTLCLGGERSPQPLLDTWAPRRALLNTYGTPSVPSCTVWQTLRRVQAGDRPTLVGRPYEGNEIRIFERDSTTEVPNGELGEILQGGVQVGIGYHKQPDLTAEKFVHLPGLDGRWYRTGDGGCVVDGELEVMGRFDNQVKIRGMRVELGDIEAGVVKASSGLLSNCCVVLRDGFLHAYGQVSVPAAVMMHEAYCILPVVSDFLLQRSSLELPRHMLPSRFVLMQQLPLTPNGKVDSKKLPQVVEIATTASASALTNLERTVAGVWGEVLGRTGIGPNDHFLALGGHSLSVLQVSRRLLGLASAAGQDVSPASSFGMLLSPEKLIHSPRLRIYCQMLARGGVRLLDAATGEVLGETISEADAADLRINYVKHKVKQPDLDPELDHGAWEQVPQTSDGELLCRAAEAGLLPLMRLLLDQAAPNDGGSLTGQFLRHGNTPLLLAVMGNHVCCAEELLRRGADPSQRDAHGAPVLHKAAERCGDRMVELLAQAGGDIEAIDTTSRSTALHAAAKRKASLDWLDRWNRSALHWAVFHGHLEVCRELLRAGANFSVSCTVGERGGRFLIAPAPCGVLPQRVAKHVAAFITPEQLAKE
ncbi:unnamed protein product [Polarella glacialis]|uniref:Carrier domain-containing protein n=1 Tax=Polarella glacialis TaxID=89957 RepID=A0A813GW30_POLGL|nr:unnamed protein product [Polarella glacialis]